jgi:hypothetical protein
MPNRKREVLFMSVKHYFPLALAVLVLAVALASLFSIPAAPFVVILLVGETLLGFQLEDHKVPRMLKQVLTPPKPHAR